MLPYLRRWAVQGTKPNSDNATTIFDLHHDGRHVMIYLATVDTYAVTVEASGVRMLADAAPYRSSMELYVALPGDEIHIYAHDQLRLLADTLTKIVATLT